MLFNSTTRHLIDDCEARIVRFGRNDTSLQSRPNVVSFKRFNYATTNKTKIGKKKQFVATRNLSPSIECLTGTRTSWIPCQDPFRFLICLFIYFFFCKKKKSAVQLAQQLLEQSFPFIKKTSGKEKRRRIAAAEGSVSQLLETSFRSR